MVHFVCPLDSPRGAWVGHDRGCICEGVSGRDQYGNQWRAPTCGQASRHPRGPGRHKRWRKGERARLLPTCLLELGHLVSAQVLGRDFNHQLTCSQACRLRRNVPPAYTWQIADSQFPSPCEPSCELRIHLLRYLCPPGSVFPENPD